MGHRVVVCDTDIEVLPIVPSVSVDILSRVHKIASAILIVYKTDNDLKESQLEDKGYIDVGNVLIDLILFLYVP